MLFLLSKAYSIHIYTAQVVVGKFLHKRRRCGCPRSHAINPMLVTTLLLTMSQSRYPKIHRVYSLRVFNAYFDFFGAVLYHIRRVIRHFPLISQL